MRNQDSEWVRNCPDRENGRKEAKMLIFFACFKKPASKSQILEILNIFNIAINTVFVLF